MHALCASDLLDLWERGSGQPIIFRALMILEAGCPDESFDILAGLSIGQRDSKLLKLREMTLGPRMICTADCPNCNQILELALIVPDLLIHPEVEPEERLSTALSKFGIKIRLPNSTDLIEALSAKDLPSAKQELLNFCVQVPQSGGHNVTVSELPEEVTSAVLDIMEMADPQANVQLAISCRSCGYAWNSVFDIVSFFWKEIEDEARRIVRDVHDLALAYGWSQSDILAMSTRRRQLYLEMVSG